MTTTTAQLRDGTSLCPRAPRTIQFSELVVASASMSGFALKPVALLAGALGVWRLAADPGWTSAFFIADGLLSRYQVWFAVAVGAQTSALALNHWVAHRNADVPATAA